MEYFIVSNGQQQGPFPVEALRTQGIGPDTLVWAQGMTNWLPASQVPELHPVIYGQQPQPQQPAYQPPVGGGAPYTPPLQGGPSQPSTDMISKPVDQVASSLDDGGLYRKWLPTVYLVLGIFSCILPILYIVQVIDNKMFDKGLTAVMAVLNILIFLAAGIVGLFYWLNRRNALKQLNVEEQAETLSLAGHFLQSAGECIGLLYFGATGVAKLLSGLFVGLDATRKGGSIIFNGIEGCVEAIITGLVILFLGRFFGEMAKKKANKNEKES